jgi:hypothetical protein
MQVFFLFCLVLGSSALPVFMQGNSKAEGAIAAGACLDVSFNGAVAAGSRVVVAVDFASSPPLPVPTTVRDAVGSSYAQLAADTDGASFGQAVFAAVAAAPFSVVTVCHAVAAGAWSWNLLEYADAAPGSAVASSDMAAVAGTAFTSAPVKVVCSDAVVFAFAAIASGSATPNAGLVVRATAAGNFVAEIPVNAGPGPYTVGGTIDANSRGWSVSLIELRGSSCVQPVNNTILPGQTVVIQGNAAVTAQTDIGGTLIVTGNLTIANGTLSMQAASVVNVGGNTDVASALNMQQGALFNVNGTLRVAAGTSVATVWTNVVGSAATMAIASFANIAGSFEFAPAVIAGTTTVPPCAQVSAVAPNVGATSLTATVSINTVLCGGALGAGSSGLSTAAIVGIAVGGGVVVIAVIVLVSVLVARHARSKNEWEEVQKKLGGGTEMGAYRKL